MVIFSAEYAYHHYNELAKEKHPPAGESALLVAPTRLELVHKALQASALPTELKSHARPIIVLKLSLADKRKKS